MYRSFDITASPISNLPKAIVIKALPGVTIKKVKAIPPARLQRLFEITLGDSRTMLLALSPPEMVRLLRSEQSLTRSEGVLIRWLTATLSSKQGSDLCRKQIPSGCASKESAGTPGGTRAGEQESSPEAGVTATVAEGKPAATSDDVDGTLHNLLPSLVAQSAAPDGGAPHETPFALYNLQQGVPLISLDQPLFQQQQNSIDYQMGRLAHRLSEITPESKRFGSAIQVLSPSPRPHAFGGFVAMPGLAAAGTWSLAFHAIFEAVLRDAEDMAVTLAYANIRRHFRRLEPVLDEVVTPRLVVVNLASPSNILVSLSDQKDMSPKGRPSEEETPDSKRSTSAPDQEETVGDEKVTITKGTDTGEAANTEAIEADTKTKPEQAIKLTGLLDWSHAIFGDPLFSRAFTHEPSQAFLHGFEGRSQVESDEPFNIENTSLYEQYGATRLLFYQCYHDIVDIVTTFYRPTKNSRAQELAARRRLTIVLAKLEKTDIPSSMRRHRRLSGEMSPAKRARIADSNDGDDDASDAGGRHAPRLVRAIASRSYTSP